MFRAASTGDGNGRGATRPMTKNQERRGRLMPVQRQALCHPAANGKHTEMTVYCFGIGGAGKTVFRCRNGFRWRHNDISLRRKGEVATRSSPYSKSNTQRRNNGRQAVRSGQKNPRPDGGILEKVVWSQRLDDGWPSAGGRDMNAASAEQRALERMIC